jgi:hypothetical protein
MYDNTVSGINNEAIMATINVGAKTEWDYYKIIENRTLGGIMAP